MRIIVCMKQVPKRDLALRLNEAGTWIREADLSWEANEPDTYALEEALRLKERFGGEVVVCSLGPARVEQLIREALAKGADRALHLVDQAFEGLDAFNAARVLAEALRRESFDLILTGLQSDDYGYAQTGVLLAELLGLPHATIVMQIEMLDGRVKVKRELEAGWFQWVELPLPALLTIQSGINQPRYATLKGIMGAKKKEIRRLTLADLGLAADELRNKQELVRVFFPTKVKRTEFLEGSPEEVAAQLIEKLRYEAKVL
ncbi:MAG: electron transfer flavoprotein subunit beta/FixA family protein [Blastocatellia bacterium]|nr:electron transfer flavoprotein subunit beta/FixA family protein [Blastocatellia bacterium]MCS7157651.1 electron transfer flavoprotein subunit beta/FixA family protein [Blastocatellia bacterium]MDW8167022.1 electron transfer flavoprotein subunit beta/FixA family protein [Acidobacteriota bacterium]MDW8257126.1 electron transfer flavoprotein subunit beta/FixA family protein [Acidobacteriota bacterium]